MASQSMRSRFSTALPFRSQRHSGPSESVSSSPSRAPDTDNPEDAEDERFPKGPLGLNLLHAPPDETLVDFVFVHGLGGGSRKSWSKTGSLAQYWPMKWLPQDPAFRNVRIHSFGYDSDFVKSKDNILDIHHFAKSLLGELATSPYLAWAEADTPIVFIGHSMGGLVIKKACLLASHDASFTRLLERIHSIYFLATPHRGSDWARLLKNILRITASSRAYVSDLKCDSAAIQAINDGFRHYPAKVHLWSFYETQKLTAGPFNALIVDPTSATLGYREEKQIPLNADHRSICKFDTPTDPNYISVRNALSSTVYDISKQAIVRKETQSRTQIKRLRDYLRTTNESVEDDLAIVKEARLPGTCRWISKLSAYVQWKDGPQDGQSILWMSGKPAAGKSVLAGYVVDDLLHHEKKNCSFFFFKHGDESKSRPSACMRSMALQMACQNAHIRDAILEMQREDEAALDSDNERLIWRKLFLSGIFRTRLERHYWVIDALDECADVASFFDTMLTKLDGSAPLRILVTSRESADLERRFSILRDIQVLSEKISTDATRPDIKAVVECNAKNLPVSDDHARSGLVNKIMEKSQGSFLWTTLVLSELGNSHSEDEVNHVLEEVPVGMEPLYQRCLKNVSQTGRRKDLIKAILSWATCANRPLTVQELENALKLDIKDNFPRLQESIVALCGNLVTVDKFRKVQLVHETAREFLLRDDLESEFAISKEAAHTRIARVCLAYLTSEEMKPPRASRRGPVVRPKQERAAFSAYSCPMFSYHLMRADPSTAGLLTSTGKFLKSNVLSWIETISQTGDLNLLVRTANNLNYYIIQCEKMKSSPDPLSSETRTISGWATDLVRIAANFADALTVSPSAIYSLILPLCPQATMAYKTASPGRSISVVGPSSARWNDRLACIVFRSGDPEAICYGRQFLAVSQLGTGKVILYHASSLQEFKTLDHGEWIQSLLLHENDEVLVSCGESSIFVWNVYSGQLIHRFPSRTRPMEWAFDKDQLIMASKEGYLASWDLSDDGASLPDRPWKGVPWDALPCAISISVGHQMLAVAYPKRPIALLDMQDGTYYSQCDCRLPSGETHTESVDALLLNPNPDMDFLAVTYVNDPQVFLLDPFRGRVLASVHSASHTLASSPDGGLIAAAGFGTVGIYKFETLTLLCQLRSSDLMIEKLAFSTDGLRLGDIRGSQCNVWEPTALRQSSVRDETVPPLLPGDVVETESEVTIEVMAVHPSGEVVFCGKRDGSVCVYDMGTGVQLRTLYHHQRPVRTLCWWPQRDAIISIDWTYSILVSSMKRLPEEGWIMEKVLFQCHQVVMGGTINQVLPGENGRFIVSNSRCDEFWSVDGQARQVSEYPKETRVRTWIQHPQSAAHMICFHTGSFYTGCARIFTWKDCTNVISVEVDGLYLPAPLWVGKIVAYTMDEGRRILAQLTPLHSLRRNRPLQLLETATFAVDGVSGNKSSGARTKGDSDTDMPPSLTKDNQGILTESLTIPRHSGRLAAICPKIFDIIGFTDANMMVFVDIRSWVCSIDLLGPDDTHLSYWRHFFVPHEWFSGTEAVSPILVGQDVLFARNDHIAIVRSGLDFVEETAIAMGGDEDNEKKVDHCLLHEFR